MKRNRILSLIAVGLLAVAVARTAADAQVSYPGIPFVAPGSDNNVLTSNGTSWVSEAPAAAGVTSNTMVAEQLVYATGAGAIATLSAGAGDEVMWIETGGGVNIPGFCGGGTARDCNPANGELEADASLMIGAGNNDPVDRFLGIKGSWDAGIKLTADRDDSDENHTAYVRFSQDNGGTVAHVGQVGAAGTCPFTDTACTNSLANALWLGSVAGSGALQLGTAGVSRVNVAADGLTTTFATGIVYADTSPNGDTVLTTLACGTTVYIGAAGDDFTLPTATNGCVIRFVVDAVWETTNVTIVTPGGANLMFGVITENGTIVCDAEDTLTLAEDAETIGDWVELRSNGTNWYMSGTFADAIGTPFACSAT